MNDAMNKLIESMQDCCDYFHKYLKEQSRTENMTPKEYGMYLQKKRNRKGKKRGAR